ncbi:MAG: hypothetical protein LC754_18690 [Acidobacteria bacterium]|nr:hypothetical protein [Acidobacteriota bacterium]
MIPAEKLRMSKEYQYTLSRFNEPQIYPAANQNIEIYRIFVSPTFSHALSIRVERKGKDYFLVAKYLSGQVGYDWGTLKGEKKRRLKEKEWQKLLDLLNRASFWTLPSEDKEPEPNEKGEVSICLDNTDWYLEGVRGGKYHVVDRYCPELRNFKAIGLYMVKLSKLDIKESDLH